MTASAWRDHLVTLADWDAMPEEECRGLELVDGVLYVVPAPLPRHQRAGVRLTNWLDEQLPPELCAAFDVDVVVKPGYPPTVRRPDVVVVPTDRFGDGETRFHAQDVEVAVEIVSPGSERTDRETKPAEYAAAGIRHYWLLEFDGEFTLAAYVLVDGRYEYASGGSGKVEVLSPVPMKFDLDLLTPR